VFSVATVPRSANPDATIPALMAEKEDWPPLLKPGEHVLCLEELHVLCVEFFRYSKERGPIFDGFRKVVRELDRMEIPADLVKRTAQGTTACTLYCDD
jgi:hypothetical protein